MDNDVCWFSIYLGDHESLIDTILRMCLIFGYLKIGYTLVLTLISAKVKFPLLCH